MSVLKVNINSTLSLKQFRSISTYYMYSVVIFYVIKVRFAVYGEKNYNGRRYKFIVTTRHWYLYTHEFTLNTQQVTLDAANIM